MFEFCFEANAISNKCPFFAAVFERVYRIRQIIVILQIGQHDFGMRRDVRQDIKTLQVEIINDESRIIEFMHTGEYDLARKCRARIESDLKYLSIIANGAPIDKDEDRKIMDFLRIHYDSIRSLSLPA